jgi:hypothetical protein
VHAQPNALVTLSAVRCKNLRSCCLGLVPVHDAAGAVIGWQEVDTSLSGAKPRCCSCDRRQRVALSYGAAKVSAVARADGGTGPSWRHYELRLCRWSDAHSRAVLCAGGTASLR